MKKLYLILAAICGCLIITFIIWNNYRLVPFAPVAAVIYRGDHELIYDKSMMNEELQKNICQVLKDYGEYCEKREDGIYIRNSLLKDMDLLQNYTCKAGGNTPRMVDSLSPDVMQQIRHQHLQDFFTVLTIIFAGISLLNFKKSKRLSVISAGILILQTICVSLIHTTDSELLGKIFTLLIFFLTISGSVFFVAISCHNWKRWLAISFAGIILIILEFLSFFQLLIDSLTT